MALRKQRFALRLKDCCNLLRLGLPAKLGSLGLYVDAGNGCIEFS